jgi:CRISPR-associated endonuclease/helicase Cas3
MVNVSVGANLQEAIAHSRNSAGVRQTLEEHLKHVSNLAGQFATEFGQQQTASTLGYLHDLGKLKDSWQDRLLRLEAGENPEWDGLKHDHKMAGAAYTYPSSPLAGLLIAGHHGGIPDFDPFKSEIESGKWEPSRTEVAEKISQLSVGPVEVTADFFSLLMLFSCLVDADSIDTSSHFFSRIVPPSFSTIEQLHDLLLAVRPSGPSASDSVLSMRNAIRQSSIEAASNAKGFFSLDAPTGSGKTISGGLFALGHAARHDLRRIIYVAPYRTIIDQTAGIYKNVFGEGNVLPHHSTADFWTTNHLEARLQRQVAENWDVPVVVTTSEQFFESLYSSRPGASRKLHNIVNSVIIIDEPQALPLRVLTPCFAVLKALVEQFGCSVLLTTATTPPLQHEGLLGSVAVTRVISQDVSRSFSASERVKVDLQKFNGSYWSELAAFMGQQKQVLAIANTKAGALAIYKSLPPQSRTFISTWLCPAHRSKVIEGVRQALLNGRPCHVASTQVIEAGVDLDFRDVMLREKAPLDSMLQAFGRCNRNGSGMGNCYIFSPQEGNRLPDYAAAIGCVNELLYRRGLDIHDPATLQLYYEMLYSQKNLDSHEIMGHIEQLNFETIRDGNDDGEGGFRLINTSQVHLVVEYGTAEQRKGLQEAIASIRLAEEDETKFPRWAARRLQNFVVSVYPQTFTKLEEAFPFALSHLYLNYYGWAGDYSDRTGLGNVIESLRAESPDEE